MDRRSSRRDDTIKQASALELVDAGRMNKVSGDGITGERGAVHHEDAVTFAAADRFASLDWVKRLDRLARVVNPLGPELLAPMTYYWVTAQSEYATDWVSL
jgi:hypothetical protein